MSSSTIICPNAKWDQNGTNISTSWYNDYLLSVYDFGIDGNDNLYILNGNNEQFYKLTSNSSTLIQVGGPGMYSPYIINRIFVDSTGAIYTYESQV